MELYTESELIQQIKDIDSQIMSASAAQSYSKDTGQSNQSVTRANIDSLRKYRRELIARLEALKGSCGVQFVNASF